MSLPRAARPSSWLVVLLPAVLVLAACDKPSHDNIEKWRSSSKGPGKLASAIRDANLDADMRAHAAEALVSVDGGLPQVTEGLAALPDSDRKAVIGKLVPRLWSVAKVPQADLAPTARQVAAKDALFEIRQFADDADKAAIDEYLVEWLTAGGFYSERAARGQHTGKQIIKAAGAKAGPKLVQMGRDLLASSDKGAAGYTPIDKDTLEGIAYSGAPEAVSFLIDVAEKTHQQEGLQIQALTALYTAYVDDTEAPKPDVMGIVPSLRRLEAIAMSQDQPGENINVAYELIAAVPDKCLPPLIKLTTHRDPIMRLRAMDFALKCAGAKAIEPMTDALPEGEYEQGIISKYVVKKIRPDVAPGALEAAKNMLGSKRWQARFIALEIFAEHGKKSDAPVVRALAGDKALLKGYWGPEEGRPPENKGKKEPTVGQRAAEVADLLEKKS
jgi:hypothetical protein